MNYFGSKQNEAEADVLIPNSSRTPLKLSEQNSDGKNYGSSCVLNVRNNADVNESSSNIICAKQNKANGNIMNQIDLQQKIWIVSGISLGMNLVLFIFKVYISVKSRSLAVIASAVDSFLDLVAQAIIFLALCGIRNVNEEKYPVGRARLEPIGIIVVASLMGVSAIQLIYESITTIIRGAVLGEDVRMLIPVIDADTLLVLGSVIAVKLFLFFICSLYSDESDSIKSLAQDHRNDVLSNGIALVTAYSSRRFIRCWWLDSVGAIIIAIYICAMWIGVAKEQAAMLEGLTAHPEFLAKVRSLGNEFHEMMFVDVVRAYHFGKRYLVEVEVVLPRDMRVEEAHDISLALQKLIERIDVVERAFVHVDYQKRSENEHMPTDHDDKPNYSMSRFSGQGKQRDSHVDTESSMDLDEELSFFSGQDKKEGYHKHMHIAHHKRFPT